MVRHWEVDLVPTVEGRTNAPEESCPVEAALKVIGGRWSTLIIRELLHGPISFSEFRTLLPALSDKVLSERLALLTNHRVVERELTPGFPATVTYRLTARGQALRPLMIALYQAGEVLLFGME